MKPRRTIRDLLEPGSFSEQSWPTIDVSRSPRAAAARVVDAATEGVLVLENGKVIGRLSANSLLAALLRDEDPITGLPRSGPLRDWLSSQLRDGNEVAIVFFDLDGFGEVNRLHGHAEGDAALQRAASILFDLCADGDFCCRFGGDEFVIGTLRNRVQAEGFARAASAALKAAGHPASFGVSGGRRSRFREEMNVDATAEDLLRVASLACMDEKQTKRREPF